MQTSAKKACFQFAECSFSYAKVRKIFEKAKRKAQKCTNETYKKEEITSSKEYSQNFSYLCTHNSNYYL